MIGLIEDLIGWFVSSLLKLADFPCRALLALWSIPNLIIKLIDSNKNIEPSH